MKRYLVGLLLVADAGLYAKTAVTYDYVCEKGEKKITHRLAFKKTDGKPPCSVYALYAKNKTKKIITSQKSSKVCEDAIDRILVKLEKQGMTCFEVENDYTQ